MRASRWGPSICSPYNATRRDGRRKRARRGVPVTFLSGTGTVARKRGNGEGKKKEKGGSEKGGGGEGQERSAAG